MRTLLRRFVAFKADASRRKRRKGGLDPTFVFFCIVIAVIVALVVLVFLVIQGDLQSGAGLI